MKKRPKKMALYLGWDGAYVLSKYPFTVHDDGETKYLSTSRKLSISDLGPEGRVVFAGLKLKMYEFVKLEITIESVTQKARKP